MQYMLVRAFLTTSIVFKIAEVSIWFLVVRLVPCIRCCRIESSLKKTELAILVGVFLFFCLVITIGNLYCCIFLPFILPLFREEVISLSTIF